MSSSAHYVCIEVFLEDLAMFELLINLFLVA